jgi:glutathione synthase
MQFLFVADPLESFKTSKDTSFAMMREAGRPRPRSARLRAERPGLGERRPGHGAGASFPARPGQPGPRRDLVHRNRGAGADRPGRHRRGADAQGPAFDSEYFYATHLLERSEREGARVFNKPRALRDHPEKLAILEFPQFIAPTSSPATRRRSSASTTSTATSS